MSEMFGVKAVEKGASGVLQFVKNLKKPAPSPTEYLIKNGAIGVNFIDTYRRSGVYPAPFPHVPGGEGAGTIVSHGDSVASPLAKGTRVAYLTSGYGAYAEYVCVPANRVVALPDSVDMDVGASLLLQGITAHYLVHDVGRVAKGDAVLVHAGAGGTGRLIIQMCKRAGASVIATTVSNEEKADIAREAGATHIIMYTEEDCDVVAEVDAATKHAKCDVVFDGVGKSTWRRSLICVKPRGTLCLFGNASGVVPPIDPLDLTKQGSVFLARPKMGDFIATDEEFQRRCKDLLSWVEDGSVVFAVGLDFSLFDAQLAHDFLETRRTNSKIVLLPQAGPDPGTPIPHRKVSHAEASE